MESTHKGSSIPVYTLDKPDLNKIDKSKIFEKFEASKDDFRDFFEKVNEPKYLYWTEAKHKLLPNGLSSEELWFLVRQFRSLGSRNTPIKAKNGEVFSWVRLPYTEEFLHKIDTNTGGQIFTSLDSLSQATKQKFLSRGILEEAIASSQLEGAHTTRQAAKKMIVENREPRNESERMILNNYKTVVELEENYKNRPMSREMLMELHKMLTDGTIDLSSQGRFRRDSDEIVVRGQIGTLEYITHIPPSEAMLNSELDRFIDYANDTDSKEFIHPIVKAIFIHFWFGYLHPFVDGNGRLARALFYWYLLKKGYWTFMYLPISTIIKKSPSQYAMAYICSEQDSFDLTYFFDFHIRKIMQALEDFNNYVEQKIEENKEVDAIVTEGFQLTERQRQLVHYLIESDDSYATITSHSTLNKISRQTAAKDIKQLEDTGLLEGYRDGKYIKFKATEKLRSKTKKPV